MKEGADHSNTYIYIYIYPRAHTCALLLYFLPVSKYCCLIAQYQNRTYAEHIYEVLSCWQVPVGAARIARQPEVSSLRRSVSQRNVAHQDAVRGRGGQHTGGRVERREGIEAASASAARPSNSVQTTAASWWNPGRVIAANYTHKPDSQEHRQAE